MPLPPLPPLPPPTTYQIPEGLAAERARTRLLIGRVVEEAAKAPGTGKLRTQLCKVAAAKVAIEEELPDPTPDPRPE